MLRQGPVPATGSTSVAVNMGGAAGAAVAVLPVQHGRCCQHSSGGTASTTREVLLVQQWRYCQLYIGGLASTSLGSLQVHCSDRGTLAVQNIFRQGTVRTSITVLPVQ